MYRILPPVDWIDHWQRRRAGDAVSRPLACAGFAADADGNETAGIAAADGWCARDYTGWNVYRAAPGEMCDRTGSYLPFARTRAERDAASDPRPALDERYASRAEYVAKVRAAADALVADRLLLPADAQAYVRAAEASDRF